MPAVRYDQTRNTTPFRWNLNKGDTDDKPNNCQNAERGKAAGEKSTQESNLMKRIVPRADGRGDCVHFVNVR